MSMGALFIGWGAAVRGRETKSLQVFQEALVGSRGSIAG
jgi:hypothetical protein